MRIHVHQLGMLSAMVAALDLMPSGARAQAGYVDPSFLNGQSGPNSWVWALAEQSDGRWLVGGQFTGFNDVPGGEVVRLNDDGSVDTNFTFNITAGDTTVHSLAVQPDGRILVGGMFTGINGAACVRIGRLNADGSLDSNFVASATSSSQSFTTVSHIGVQTNLQIVIAGWFDTVDGRSRNRLARLQASLAPVISRPRTAGGLFSFDVNAVAGQTYGIVAATNLTGPWVPIASTNAAFDNLTFTTNTAQFPSRIFRAFR